MIASGARGTIAMACLLLACSSENEGRKAQDAVARTTQALDVTPSGRYLRVRVAYDAGHFQVERVTWVDGELRQPRSGKPRHGFRYLAEAPGKAAFLGSAPDPRTLHVEVPDATGRLAAQEIPAPGKQHFLIYVPAHTETVDFQAPPSGRGASSSAGAAAQTLGSIDLRSFK